MSCVPYNQQLERVYKDIDQRNAVPTAQPSFAGHCKAIWASGYDFVLNDAMVDLYEQLGTAFGSAAYIFEPAAEAPAALHWTLFQLQTFPVETRVGADERNEARLVADLIGRYPPIHITFRGIVRTRYGLFLAGYPSWDVNRLRDEFRRHFRVVEPHPQDICHATLLRFREEPTACQVTALDRLVAAFEGRQLGELQVRRWYYGYGTWLQGAAADAAAATANPRLIASWPAGPAHWILHRGLSSGPSAAVENCEATLKTRLAEGWGVELDIWVVDGQVYLGHDWSAAERQPLANADFFLQAERAWVHCKNLPALAWMCEQVGRRCRFFVHDSDEATLTSACEPWCYPGKWAGPQSICVLPERSATAAAAAAAVFGRVNAGVCSDYLPAHFLTADLFEFADFSET